MRPSDTRAIRWFVRNLGTTTVVVPEYLVATAAIYAGLKYLLDEPPKSRCGVDSCYASDLFEAVVLIGIGEVALMGLLISLTTLAGRALGFIVGPHHGTIIPASCVLCGGLELLKVAT